MEENAIKSVKELLQMEKLNIPNYQRPYKWSTKNISDLLEDIDTAIANSEKYLQFKYRIGTIIIQKNENKEKNTLTLDIVDRTAKNYFSCFNWTISRDYFKRKL